MSDEIKQAVTALNSGKQEEAKQILIDVVTKNPEAENAWLWLAKAVDTPEEQSR